LLGASLLEGIEMKKQMSIKEYLNNTELKNEYIPPWVKPKEKCVNIINEVKKGKPNNTWHKEQTMHGDWQKRRLEIMSRDNFMCRVCKSKCMLSVHHLYYEKGKKLWEYEDEVLVTVCDSCHKAIHFELMKTAGIIAFKILIKEIDPINLNI
jgi:5-methylcytosine-specific restriction endonuclease McrA